MSQTMKSAGRISCHQIILTLAALILCFPPSVLGEGKEKAPAKTQKKKREIVFENSSRRRKFFDAQQGKPPRKLVCSKWIPGGKFDLEQQKGKVVLIVFFGSWCSPCKRLMPRIIEWGNTYQDQGFEIVGIHSIKEAEQADAYLKEQKVPFKVGIDFKGSTFKRFKVLNLPSFFLVDRSGILRFADVSNHKSRYMTDAIETLLEEEPPGSEAQEEDKAAKDGKTDESEKTGK